MKHDLDSNKQNAIDFYRTAYLGNPSQAVEDYLVALHTHQTWPGNEHYVTMDFFRFDENGKIVEHWDSIQEIPGETRNGNTMY